MFESLDNTPTLKSQPTSLIFSLDADDGKNIRALLGDGFIFLCCEDLDEDFHKFSQYFTGQKLKKYVKSPSNREGDFLDTQEISCLLKQHWVSCWENLEVPLTPAQRTYLLRENLRFGYMLCTVHQDPENIPVCTVTDIKCGKSFHVYDWFVKSVESNRIYVTTLQIRKFWPVEVAEKVLGYKSTSLSSLSFALSSKVAEYYKSASAFSDKTMARYYLVSCSNLPESYKAEFMSSPYCGVYPYFVLRKIGFPKSAYLEKVIADNHLKI